MERLTPGWKKSCTCWTSLHTLLCCTPFKDMQPSLKVLFCAIFLQSNFQWILHMLKISSRAMLHSLSKYAVYDAISNLWKKMHEVGPHFLNVFWEIVLQYSSAGGSYSNKISYRERPEVKLMKTSKKNKHSWLGPSLNWRVQKYFFVYYYSVLS